MTQDELWITKYNEVIGFMDKNHRNPSKHRLEEHRMLNFVKHNRKLLNAGKLKEDRVVLFNNLLIVWEKYRHVNQYM